jgi:1-acyl-sn-glycerol-3-phosphate acyltransferase
MQTPLTSILCFLAASVLGAVGQFLYKSGADQAAGTAVSYVLNPRLLAGVVCYVAVMVLFVAAFRRGEPEQLADFKTGVAHLAQRHPDVPFVPIYLHGLGKALPRGEAVLVPFFCDVFVGDPFVWNGDRQAFMRELTTRMTELAKEGHFPEWV